MGVGGCYRVGEGEWYKVGVSGYYRVGIGEWYRVGWVI